MRQAEQQGFRSAWIPDQPFYCDPYVVLAAAAAETERIKLGVGVTNPFTAHPAISARIAASSCSTGSPAGSGSASQRATNASSCALLALTAQDRPMNGAKLRYR